MTRTLKTLLFAMTLVLFWSVIVTAAETGRRHEVIVVGAGIAGLAATWELAQKDVDVAVMDMQAHSGGTALMSEGPSASWARRSRFRTA